MRPLPHAALMRAAASLSSMEKAHGVVGALTSAQIMTVFARRHGGWCHLCCSGHSYTLCWPQLALRGASLELYVCLWLYVCLLYMCAPASRSHHASLLLSRHMPRPHPTQRRPTRGLPGSASSAWGCASCAAQCSCGTSRSSSNVRGANGGEGEGLLGARGGGGSGDKWGVLIMQGAWAVQVLSRAGRGARRRAVRVNCKGQCSSSRSQDSVYLTTCAALCRAVLRPAVQHFALVFCAVSPRCCLNAIVTRWRQASNETEHSLFT